MSVVNMDPVEMVRRLLHIEDCARKLVFGKSCADDDGECPVCQEPFTNDDDGNACCSFGELRRALLPDDYDEHSTDSERRAAHTKGSAR